MKLVQTFTCYPLLSALDPGTLATVWATVSALGLLASLLAGALLGRC